MNTLPTFARPPFESIPLADGLKWRGGGEYLYEEKLDGVWSVETIKGCHLAGERMKSGRFIAFDLLGIRDRVATKLPLRERLAMLDELTENLKLLRPARGNGGEFLETVLARGGEGVVAKHLDSIYGAPWLKCKRVETFDVVLVEKHSAKNSVRLAWPNLEDAGWMRVSARKFVELQAGKVIEVCAYGIQNSGRLREARLVRTRPDKTAV